MNAEERDRLTRLESNVEYMAKEVASMKATVQELRDLLVSAKGVRWALSILIAIAGFFSGLVSQYLPHWPGK